MSVSLEFDGVKLGRLSKSTRKLPCSPQPSVGVAVGDEAGNGLLNEDELSVLLALLEWVLRIMLELEAAGLEELTRVVVDVEEEDGVMLPDMLEEEVFKVVPALGLVIDD